MPRINRIEITNYKAWYCYGRNSSIELAIPQDDLQKTMVGRGGGKIYNGGW